MKKYGYCKECGEKVIIKNSKCTQCGSKDITTYIKTSHCKTCNKMTLFFYDGNSYNLKAFLKNLIMTMFIPFWFIVWVIIMIKNKNLYRCSECGHTKHL